jgi:hypothetical protein
MKGIFAHPWAWMSSMQSGILLEVAAIVPEISNTQQQQQQEPSE